MNKLIIDATNKKIFLMIITDNDIYSIIKENTKINYEKLTSIVNDFLNSHQITLKGIDKIYLNTGRGSFAGIRNSISIVKAFNLVNKIDYYCYNFEDFKGETDINYENIPDLCDKFRIKKNLINPIYLS